MIPYSDKPDGWIQLSCTLPYSENYDVEATVNGFAESMHLTNTRITNITRMNNFVFVVFYAQVTFDITPIVKTVSEELLSREEVSKILKDNCNRQIRILGASIGEDAHTVGLDAIFNMKGYHGDYGLERYPCFLTKNLGAQVSITKLLEEIDKFQPDVICLSQTVTQNDLHIKTLNEVKKKLDELKITNKILICGGMHITQKLAESVGFDFGFGRGSTAVHVANAILNVIKVKNFVLQKVTSPVIINLPVKQRVPVITELSIQQQHYQGFPNE